MSSTKPCYSPMLAGQTLYRDSRERNRKKQCFFTICVFLWNPQHGLGSQRPSNFCCKPFSFSSMLSGFFCSIFSGTGVLEGSFSSFGDELLAAGCALFVRLFAGGAGRSIRFFVGASCRRSLACFAASLSTLPAGWPSKSTRSAPSRMDLI